MLSISYLSLLKCYLQEIIPRARAELNQWYQLATTIPHPLLRQQALNSIVSKSFHALGGASLALAAPPQRREEVIRFIVALQTISDYLDNLCDRCGIYDERVFFTLHQAMSDALLWETPLRYYYARFGASENIYLPALVVTCRSTSSRLPFARTVRAAALQLIYYYRHLQAFKHTDPLRREQLLHRFFQPLTTTHPGFYWWEIAAAAGSTLGVFALYALAADSQFSLGRASAWLRLYFPYVSALHILLDYFIDLPEDITHNDFNFFACYPNNNFGQQRLIRLYQAARRQASNLPDRQLHTLIIDGLPAVYLSDAKARHPLLRLLSPLSAVNRSCRHLWYLCHFLRPRLITTDNY